MAVTRRSNLPRVHQHRIVASLLTAFGCVLYCGTCAPSLVDFALTWRYPLPTSDGVFGSCNALNAIRKTRPIAHSAEGGTRFDSPNQASFTKTLETVTTDLARGSVFAGRFEVIEELGKGGMGRVYRVFDTQIKGRKWP